MAVNQHVNKVILNGTTLMDVSDNTITDEDMMEGVTATMPDGSTKTGKMRLDDLEYLTDARGGIRYYNGNYQVYDVANETWVDLSIGSSGGDYGSFVKLGDVSDISVYGVISPVGIKLKWTDPDDVIITGSTGIGTFAEWDGTLIVRKVGSAPNNIEDGVTVLNSKTRNAYKNEYYTDTNNVQIGVNYYYRFFPYSKSGIITAGSVYQYTVTMPSWETSSDEEISSVIELSDNGQIDLYSDCGWRVGDCRKGYKDIYYALAHRITDSNSAFMLETPKNRQTLSNYPDFMVISSEIDNGSNSSGSTGSDSSGFNQTVLNNIGTFIQSIAKPYIRLDCTSYDYKYYSGTYVNTTNDTILSEIRTMRNTSITDIAQKFKPLHVKEITGGEKMYSNDTEWDVNGIRYAAYYNSGNASTFFRINHVKRKQLDIFKNLSVYPSNLSTSIQTPDYTRDSNFTYYAYVAGLLTNSMYLGDRNYSIYKNTVMFAI